MKLLPEFRGRMSTVEKWQTAHPDPKIDTHLQYIYKLLVQRFPEFPYGKCIDASELVQAVRLDLWFVEGRFRVDHKVFPWRELYEHHSWCEDRDGRIIDLTVSQFNKALREKIPAGVVIISQESSLYSRYTRGALEV